MLKGNDLLSTDKYTIHIINNLHELLKIANVYNSLISKENGPSHFLSFDWLYLYLKYVPQKNHEIAIYLLYKNNELAGIAPLARKRRNHSQNLRFILENTQADYLDFIYNNMNQSELEYFISKIMNGYSFSALRLKKIPENSLTAASLASLKTLKIIEVSKEKCIHIKFCKSMDEYFQNLGKSTRKEIKATENRIRKNFKSVEITFLYHQDISENLLDNLMAMYKERRIVKFGSEKRSQEYFEFLKEYILNNKDIFISILRLDGKDIAFNIGFFALNNSLEILITSFDSQYRKYDVGNFLLYKSIVSFLESGLAKTRGLIYYDLGQGDELYKIKYGGEMHYIKEYLIFNSFIYYSIKKAELRGKAIVRIVWKKILYIFQKEYLKRIFEKLKGKAQFVIF